jgi:S-DNA-T family DNA segregation ATPase FtsK/SpoIIIE
MEQKSQLNNILAALHIKAVCSNHFKVKNMSFYDLMLLDGGRIRDFEKYLSEISLFLKTPEKPTIKIIYELGIIRLEVVDEKPELIDFYSNYEINDDSTLPIYLGNTIDNKKLNFDMAQNPNLLIAGSPGSGKSTLLHAIIASALIQNNSDIFLVDTKNIEFDKYKNIYKNIEIATSYSDALHMISYLNSLMNSRYLSIKENKLSSRHFYNKNPIEKHILFIIDEFADLIMQDSEKKLHNLLCQLSQKCRAAGIYCILATQRPSVNILSGTIKANYPARIACKVASKIDSRVILDRTGAENLLGNGDAIIKNYNNNYQRFQTAYILPEQVNEKMASKS